MIYSDPNVSDSYFDSGSAAHYEQMDFVDETHLGSDENFVAQKVNAFIDSGLSVSEGSSILVDMKECEQRNTLIGRSTSKRTIRYPGDIKEDEEMSQETARRNIILCKKKIKTQAQEIYKLKQTVRRQKKQILTLKQLLTNMKNKFSLSSHAVQSIEVYKHGL